jgi:hypothetical protein
MHEIKVAVMTWSASVLMAFALIACAGVLSSCSLLSDPCGAVMPTVTASQAQLADVQRAIAQVEASGVRDALRSDDAREAFDDAMTKVRHGYSVAVQSLAVAAKACDAPDLRGAIALIVEGWDVVRSFLSLFGGNGTPAIADPLVWTEAQR